MRAAKTGAKQRSRGFQKGVSGNPFGRPAGSRNKVTLAVDALLDGEAEALTRRAIDLALGGDLTALKLCLERVAPVRRDRVLELPLPKIENAADAVQAMSTLVAAAAAGALSFQSANEVANLIEKLNGALTISDFDMRLAQLEAKAK